MKILRGTSGKILTTFSGGTRRLLYVADKIITGGYGRLYNWFCTQPQITGIKYGYLYNWYAATDIRNIASAGWHTPSRVEWTALETYLKNNGYGYGGVGPGIAKSIASTSGWNVSINVGAIGNDQSLNNTSGLNIKQHACRYGTSQGGAFMELNTGNAYLWSSTSYNTIEAYIPVLQAGASNIQLALRQQKVMGAAIRPVKDSTTLTHGQTGTYTGNDGRIYKTICIGSQEWLSENLAETKYRNGDLIPKVTDNTAWAALTTGAMCAYNNDEANVFETASIAPVGFHVPDYIEKAELFFNNGSTTTIGGRLKSLTGWDDPNVGATDELGFHAKGSGQRFYTDGSFSNLKIKMPMHVSDDTGWLDGREIIAASAAFANANTFYQKKSGLPIRLLKNDSTFTLGDTVIDFDGNIYPLVKIGDQVWTASNWKCTKLNDGTPIPLVEDNAAWAARTEMAQCIYNNDIENL